MAATKRVLFICTGNACRSVMAEQLLRHWARERALDVETRSAGVAAEGYFQVPATVRSLLAGQGAPPFAHTPRLATRESLAWADLVLVMSTQQQEHLQERFPEHADKVRLLRQEAGLDEEDIADPIGGSEEDFALCLARLRESLEGLIRRVPLAPARG